VVFRSVDEGKSWQVISPDLTRNDKTKQASSGGDITKDNTSVEYYDTVFALAESPKTKGLLWAGSDDGLIYVTRNGGQKWTSHAETDARVEHGQLIEASPHDAGTAWVAVDRHKLDDLKPYIYVTRDFGQTWSAIVTGIPEARLCARSAKIRRNRGCCTRKETGVFVSVDAGAIGSPCTEPAHSACA